MDEDPRQESRHLVRAPDRWKQPVAALVGVGILATALTFWYRPANKQDDSDARPVPFAISPGPPEMAEAPRRDVHLYQEPEKDDLEFTELLDYLSDGAKQPAVAPVAKKFMEAFSAHPELSRTVSRYKQQADYGDVPPKAKAFMNEIRRIPAFQKLVTRLASHPDTKNALALLARNPALKEFLRHEVGAYTASSKAGSISGERRDPVLATLHGPPFDGSGAPATGDLSGRSDSFASPGGLSGLGSPNGKAGGGAGGSPGSADVGAAGGPAKVSLGGNAGGGGGSQKGTSLGNAPGAGRDREDQKLVTAHNVDVELKDRLAKAEAQLAGGLSAAGSGTVDDQILDGRIKTLLQVYPWLENMGRDQVIRALKSASDGDLVHDYGAWGACFSIMDPGDPSRSLYDKCFKACSVGKGSLARGAKPCGTTLPSESEAWKYCLDYARNDDLKCLKLCNSVTEATCAPGNNLAGANVLTKYCHPQWKWVDPVPPSPGPPSTPGKPGYWMKTNPIAPKAECTEPQRLQYSNGAGDGPPSSNVVTPVVVNTTTSTTGGGCSCDISQQPWVAIGPCGAQGCGPGTKPHRRDCGDAGCPGAQKNCIATSECRCACDLSRQSWVTSGGCGQEGCGSDEIPQYQTCNAGCNVNRRCAPSSCDRCVCDITEKPWVTSGGCGQQGCATGSIPQYRACDAGCTVENRCLSSASCGSCDTAWITSGGCGQQRCGSLDIPQYRQCPGEVRAQNRCFPSSTCRSQCISTMGPGPVQPSPETPCCPGLIVYSPPGGTPYCACIREPGFVASRPGDLDWPCCPGLVVYSPPDGGRAYCKQP